MPALHKNTLMAVQLCRVLSGSKRYTGVLGSMCYFLTQSRSITRFCLALYGQINNIFFLYKFVSLIFLFAIGMFPFFTYLVFTPIPLKVVLYEINEQLFRSTNLKNVFGVDWPFKGKKV